MDVIYLLPFYVLGIFMLLAVHQIKNELVLQHQRIGWMQEDIQKIATKEDET